MADLFIRIILIFFGIYLFVNGAKGVLLGDIRLVQNYKFVLLKKHLLKIPEDKIRNATGWKASVIGLFYILFSFLFISLALFSI